MDPAHLRIPDLSIDIISREAAILAGLRSLGVIALALAALFVVRRTLSRMTTKDRIDATGASFLGAAVKYVVWIVVGVAILAEFGVDTSSLMGSLGIVGLTLGFAAKDALSNVISGLFILWDRPFTIGDLIDIDGKYGRVATITMRSTRVVTPDGRMLAIPNATVVNTTVASYTNFPHLRLDIPVTVGVEEDIGRVREVLQGAMKGVPGLLPDRERQVVVVALNDYNIALELRVWLEDETQHIRVRHQVREQAFEALRRANVNMPFETFALIGPSN